MSNVHPRQPAPDLEVETLDGGRWQLSAQQPESFTMIVFYRGLHCPVCRQYLGELSGMGDEFESRGVEVIAVSGDTLDRAERARDQWELDGLKLGYELPVDVMRRWGLFVSKAIKDEEPDEFGEPALVLVDPDGRVFYTAVNSMPFGRPKLEDIRDAVDFVKDRDYPARGEA